MTRPTLPVLSWWRSKIGNLSGLPQCHEALAGEPAELPEPPCRGDHPANHGIDENHLRDGGWKALDPDTWAHVDNEGGHMVAPTEENFKPEDFPWRSSWIYDQGWWSQIEDEVRWRDLRDREWALPEFQGGEVCPEGGTLLANNGEPGTL